MIGHDWQAGVPTSCERTPDTKRRTGLGLYSAKCVATQPTARQVLNKATK